MQLKVTLVYPSDFDKMQTLYEQLNDDTIRDNQ